MIAILAGMLLHALSKAKDAGKAVQCLNNLKQIGLATEQYSTDYEMYVPLCGKYGFSNAGKNMVHSPVYIYLKNNYATSGVLTCNAADNVTNRLAIPDVIPDTTGPLWWYSDYGYNTSGVGHDWCGKGFADEFSQISPLRPGQAKTPSMLIAFADAARTPSGGPLADPNYGTMFAVDINTGTGVVPMPPRGFIRDRHNKKGNIVFLDCHAESVRDPLMLHVAGANMTEHVSTESHKYFCRKTVRK